jgi:uncharacterized protein YndB with AHSA1/START domain
MTATATIDAARGAVDASVEIGVPRERAFRAFTDPQALERWWGSDDSYRTSDWTLDLRPGGQWSCTARTVDGHLSSVRGEYITIDPPRLLEFTWSPSWENFAATRVRIEFEEIPTGTRVGIRHTGFADVGASDGHAKGWIRVLDWLAGYDHGAHGAGDAGHVAA